ncbi:MAG TPA: hypothetical protein VKV95_00080, partial [Terriglobia bacterium]|nr:hypothetical protein [Terriglobia bacterium]
AFGNELASFGALSRALASARCPWFGVDLNPVSMLKDEWPMEEIFSRMGQIVRHVRARDAVLGAGIRTRPAVVGMGSVNWENVLTMLDDCGYREWITIDPLDLPDHRAGVIMAVRKLADPGTAGQ